MHLPGSMYKVMVENYIFLFSNSTCNNQYNFTFLLVCFLYRHAENATCIFAYALNFAEYGHFFHGEKQTKCLFQNWDSVFRHYHVLNPKQGNKTATDFDKTKIRNRQNHLVVWTLQFGTGLKKYLNSTLPVGQVTSNFACPGDFSACPIFFKLINNSWTHEWKSNYRHVLML